MPLTPKQERFVAEYLVDLNATQAAVRAGYGKKSAHATGYDNLKLPEVAAAIRDAQSQRSERTKVTADRVVRELARLAFLDPRRVMTWGPDGVAHRPSSDLDADDAACVVEASQTVTEGGGTIRVKLADKVSALQLLGKHLGMFVERMKIDGTVPAVVELVVRTREEAAALAAAADGSDGSPAPRPG